jgi:hypothetical protein
MDSLILFLYTWLGKHLLTKKQVMNGGWLLLNYGKLPKRWYFSLKPNYLWLLHANFAMAYMYCDFCRRHDNRLKKIGKM